MKPFQHRARQYEGEQTVAAAAAARRYLAALPIAITLMWSIPAFAWPPSKPRALLTIPAENGADVRVWRRASRIFATALQGRRRLRVDPQLAHYLRASEASTYRSGIDDDGKRYAAITVSLPSRANRGAGYCGGGDERFLLLVALEHDMLALRDALLFSSCLHDVELDPDPDPDAGRASAVDDAVMQLPGAKFAIRWLGAGANIVHVATARAGRWSVSTLVDACDVARTGERIEKPAAAEDGTDK